MFFLYFLSLTPLLILLSLLLYLGLKKRVGGIRKSRRMNAKDEMDAVVVWVVMVRYLAGQGGHMMGL